MERVAISGGPEMDGKGDKSIPQSTLPQTQSATGASQERFVKGSGAPLVEAHSDENSPPNYNSTTSTGVGATRSTVGEREMAEVHVNTEPTGLLVGASTHWYPRDPYDPSIEADQVDMQAEVSTLMDKDDDEEDPSFGVLFANTTFYPLLAYQPHLHGHDLNIEQDDPIIEDIGSGLVADSVMEDPTPDSRRVDTSLTGTGTLQPSSWVPPSTSGTLHAIFPGVPLAHMQIATFIDDPVPASQHHTHSDTYAVDIEISAATRAQQVVPLQDIVRPFVLDREHPSPSAGGRLPEEPQITYEGYSHTFETNVFPSQAASRPSLPSPSTLTSRVGPVAISPPTCGSIEVHKGEVKGLEGEVCSEPPDTASAETSHPRYV